LKDPNIYSLRSEIALNDLYLERLLAELKFYTGEAAPPPVEERLTYNEPQLWGRIQDAIELRTRLVGQEVKTLELLANHSGRQAERARALTSVVIEVLRNRMAGSPEGRRQLVEVADELETKVRELQALEGS
jgi:hypothetical protein